MGLREDAIAAAEAEHQVGDTVTVGGVEFVKHSDGAPSLPPGAGPEIGAEAFSENGLGTADSGRHGVPDTHVYDPEKADYIEPGANPGNLPVQTAPAEVSTKPTVVHGTPLRLSPEQHAFLLRGIDPNRVKHLRGQSHLEAWDVRRTLNRAFGFGGWDDQTIELTCVAQLEHPPTTSGGKPRWTVVYRAQVRLTIKNPDGTPGAVFEDGAAGDSQNQPSLGDAHDQAMKTALSQALKRCAVNLGDQFGMSLYNGGGIEPVVIGTLAGPVIEGGDVVNTLTRSAPVRGEQETQGYRDDPGQHPDSDPVSGMPSPHALRDEATNPNTSYDRLRAIYSMVNRKKGAHPHLGVTEVTNENGDAEPLDYLVWRKLDERKKAQQ
jgi:hypothetical protein